MQNLTQNNNQPAEWVKVFFDKNAWNEYYSSRSGYTFLNRDGDGVWAGTIVAKKDITSKMTLLNNEEVQRVHEHRMSTGLLPTPWKIIER